MEPTLGKNLEQVLQLCRALGGEIRLRLIERLRAGEQCVCDLTDDFKTGQSRLSFHLKILKDAGVVTDRRQGRYIYYALNLGAFEQLERLAQGMRPIRRESHAFDRSGEQTQFARAGQREIDAVHKRRR